MHIIPDSVVPAPGRVLAVAAGAAVMAGVGMAVARRICAERPPADSEWRRVGQISELRFFPLKSGRPSQATSLMATEDGLESGSLRDRVFVVVNRDGNFISGRSHPKLVFVTLKAIPRAGTSTASEKDVVFELSSPHVPTVLTLDPEELRKVRPGKIRVWSMPVSAVDCGDEAAAWIRKAAVDPKVHGEATVQADLRLAFFPLTHTDRNPKALKGNPGIYTDMTSYHLITSSSLAALNAKLPNPVTTGHFRPNFVVEGTSAFEEDNWAWIRIGNKTIFRVVMPCGRCVFTTVDPETGIKSADNEPLKTLNEFRKPNAEQRKRMGGSSPMLGLRLGIYQLGEVAVGDAVYVAP